MFGSHLRISLISLKKEEMDSLVVSFCTEPELVLDRAKLPMQLHSAYTSLLAHLPHSSRNLILPLLDQPLRQTPNAPLVTGQQKEKRLIPIPAINDSTCGRNPDPLSGLHPAPVHDNSLGGATII